MKRKLPGRYAVGGKGVKPTDNGMTFHVAKGFLRELRAKNGRDVTVIALIVDGKLALESEAIHGFQLIETDGVLTLNSVRHEKKPGWGGWMIQDILMEM